jgi:2-haloacid dehalogenase
MTLATITFSCYGTLVDKEAGIVAAIRPYLAAHGHEPDDDDILALFDGEEAKARTGAYLPYRNVLRQIMRGFGFRYRFSHTDDEIRALERSFPHWPMFPDAPDALRRLATKYKLAIITGVDDDLIEATVPRFGVPFDHVVTGQRVGAGKPSIKLFRGAIAAIGEPKEHLLHVASSLYKDIAPAKACGIKTVLVDRYPAPPAGPVLPDRTVADLFALCEALDV